MTENLSRKVKRKSYWDMLRIEKKLDWAESWAKTSSKKNLKEGEQKS